MDISKFFTTTNFADTSQNKYQFVLRVEFAPF